MPEFRGHHDSVFLVAHDQVVPTSLVAVAKTDVQEVPNRPFGIIERQSDNTGQCTYTSVEPGRRIHGKPNLQLSGSFRAFRGLRHRASTGPALFAQPRFELTLDLRHALFHFLVNLNLDGQRDISQVDLAGRQDGAHRREYVAVRRRRVADNFAQTVDQWLPQRTGYGPSLALGAFDQTGTTLLDRGLAIF
jgi:hypothetical protein